MVKMVAMIDNESVMRLIPKTIQEISEVIGLDNALKLVDSYGGIELDIPSGLGSHESAKRLISVIGREAAAAMCHIYAKEKLYIPNCTKLKTLIRNHQFYHALLSYMERGTSQTQAIKELAPEFGITERYAYGVIADMNKQECQLDLFDF